MTLTNAQIRLLKELRGNGFSQREIGKELGLTQAAVAYNLQKLKKNYRPLPKEAAELIERASSILVEMVKVYADQKRVI